MLGVGLKSNNDNLFIFYRAGSTYSSILEILIMDIDEPSVILSFPEEGVAELKLNRPQATNALSLELQTLLSKYFTELRCSLYFINWRRNSLCCWWRYKRIN